MNPVLLVLLISSVAGHVSLRYYPRGPVSGRLLRYYVTDEAHQAAQAILDVLKKADVTTDKALFLSAFDKSLVGRICQSTWTYSDLEKKVLNNDPIKTGNEIKLKTAEITGDELKFTVVEIFVKESADFVFVAKRVGGSFKITKLTVETAHCPSVGAKQLFSSSSEEDNY